MKANIPTDRWKVTLDDYVAAAGSLCASMAHRGFLPQGAVPVDPDGELLDGSHRVACALALGIEEIPVMRTTRRAWAPPWGEAWFRDHGMGEEELERLRQDLKRLMAPFYR